MSEKEYIERGVLVSILYAKSDMAMGTPKAVFASVSKMVELLPAADVVSRGVFEQVKWERDVAMQQLEEHGIPFGGVADVVAVRYGAWIHDKTEDEDWGGTYHKWTCSCCGYSTGGNPCGKNYCPNCGAKMDGGKDQNEKLQ